MRLRAINLLALLLLPACGGEVVVGGVDTYVTSSAGAEANPALLGDRAMPALTAAAAPQGTLAFVISAAVVDAGGREAPITSGEVQARFSLNLDTAIVGQMLVPSGSYTGVRLRFREVHVEGVTGLQIPGIPVGATITVGTGADPIQVDVPVAVRVREWENQALIVDVNAAQWLAAAEPLGLVVPESAFRQAVQVRRLE